MSERQESGKTHALSFGTPSYADYIEGGFGDWVARCSCGAYDYVYSASEGEYWHSLHAAHPHANPFYLTVHHPMPEGWNSKPVVADMATHSMLGGPRTWICPACKGRGSVEAYGAHGGRFYQFGAQAECSTCGGSGRVHTYLQTHLVTPHPLALP